MKKSKTKAPFQPDLMDFPFGHGGKRPGAGRPQTSHTCVVRIPADLLNLVTEIKHHHEAGHIISVSFQKPVGRVNS